MRFSFNLKLCSSARSIVQGHPKSHIPTTLNVSLEVAPLESSTRPPDHIIILSIFQCNKVPNRCSQAVVVETGESVMGLGGHLVDVDGYTDHPMM